LSTKSSIFFFAACPSGSVSRKTPESHPWPTAKAAYRRPRRARLSADLAASYGRAQNAITDSPIISAYFSRFLFLKQRFSRARIIFQGIRAPDSHFGGKALFSWLQISSIVFQAL
jgi:hypothetical protein